MIYPRLGPTFREKKGLKLGMWYTAISIDAVGNPTLQRDLINSLINLPNSGMAHPYRNEVVETNVCGIFSNLLALTTVKLQLETKGFTATHTTILQR